MPISRANGPDIHYEVAGAGAPLVLIHALPFDHNLWLYQVERFSSSFRTIAMDLRGWGRSAKPRTPFSLRDMGDDILGVLRDENVTAGAVVMGCSIGSKIALMLASDHPELFRAAVLVGGNSGPQPQFDHRIAAYRSHHAAGTLTDYHLGHLRHGVTQTWADTPIGHYLLAGFVERGGTLDPECIAHVFRGTRTAACDDRDTDGLRDARGQLEIITVTTAVLVDARDEDLARTQIGAALCPLDGVELRGIAAAVREHAEPCGVRGRSCR